MSFNVFQSSKSALIFAGAVILTTLVLVGPDEGGGVLGSVAETHSNERGRIAYDAAAASQELSMLSEQAPPKPSAWEANPMIDYNLMATPESAAGMPVIGSGGGSGNGSGNFYGAQQPSSNPATAPLSSEAILVGPGGGVGGGEMPVNSAQAPRGEAVVTSRMIKIEPQ